MVPERYRRTDRRHAISSPRSALASRGKKVAAAVQRQNVQHRSVLLRDCYFADRCSAASAIVLAATAAITCFAAVPFLGLQSPGTATVASVNEALGR